MHQFQDVSAMSVMLMPANAPNLARFMPAACELRVENDEQARESRWAGLLPWQTKRVRDYVEADLHGQVSLKVAASRARLSPGYFSRRFRQSFGLSFSRFVAARRIDRARGLILGEGGNLCEIALACGFADQSHFTRTFSNLMGCPPSQWRRQAVGARLSA